MQENGFLGRETTEYVLNNSKVQELLNSTKTFDLVILEQFINEALLGLGSISKLRSY